MRCSFFQSAAAMRKRTSPPTSSRHSSWQSRSARELSAWLDATAVIRARSPTLASWCRPSIPATVTPHTEAFQAVVWHGIVSHPKLLQNEMKWESVR